MRKDGARRNETRGVFWGEGGHLGVASVIGRNLDMFELCTLYCTFINLDIAY